MIRTRYAPRICYALGHLINENELLNKDNTEP